MEIHKDTSAKNVHGRTLDILPGEGIGPLKLGMTAIEIERAIEKLATGWELPIGRDIQVSEEKECCGFTRRYISNAFFFMVQFQDDRAAEIAVDYALRAHALIQIYGVDIFRTPAEDLVALLEARCACMYDLPDKQLSTNYEFPGIGIRLWREDAFHPKVLQDAAYMDEMKLVIEDMYRYLYFEIVAVRR